MKTHRMQPRSEDTMTQPAPQSRQNPRQKLGRTFAVVLLLAGAALLSVATSTSPPAIDRITPDLGSSSVAVDQPLTIELERAVDPDTATAQTVRLRCLADGHLVEASLDLTDSDHRIVLRPTTRLASQTDYELELDLATLTDTDGNAYAGLRYDESLSSVWETSGLLRVPFTTRQSLTVGRAFLITDPDEMILYFSETVDVEALTTQTVSLHSEAGSVPIDLRYNAAENRLRVLPLTPLGPGQSYTLQLSPDITTPDGAQLAEGAGEVLSFHMEDERIR
jgi:Bacterial Ig-like domain